MRAASRAGWLAVSLWTKGLLTYCTRPSQQDTNRPSMLGSKMSCPCLFITKGDNTPRSGLGSCVSYYNGTRCCPGGARAPGVHLKRTKRHAASWDRHNLQPPPLASDRRAENISMRSEQ